MRGKDATVSRVVTVCQVLEEMLVPSSAGVAKMLETRSKKAGLDRRLRPIVSPRVRVWPR